jgi:phenylalanyl-tRNA synthetase alpha subunit
VPAGFDPTRPGILVPLGRLHPITQLRYDLDDAFASLGFEIYDGPEISSELYEFDALAFPPDHPARESMDTYWLEGRDARSGAERHCLRPHLTGGSVRYMQEHTPPFRFVYPGKRAAGARASIAREASTGDSEGGASCVHREEVTCGGYGELHIHPR